MSESVIIRENQEELIEKNKSENSEKIFSECPENSKKSISECRDNLLSYKTINIHDLKELENIKDLFEENTDFIEKQSEALLWHARLGHASLNYLKMLQTKENIYSILNLTNELDGVEYVYYLKWKSFRLSKIDLGLIGHSRGFVQI